VGVALSWIAAQGADGALLMERLGLEPCGSATDEINSDYACTVLPNGWFLVASRGMRLKLDAALPIASANCVVLGGEVEEHVMFSRLQEYRDGQQTWSVRHDPEVERYGVATTGEPPPEFAKIHAGLSAEHEADEDGDVDYFFDVPVRLGERLCGYAHDAPGALRVWTVLEERQARRAPRPAPRLESVLEHELLPDLQALGWSRLAEPIMGGLELERVRDGARQFIQIEWQDHPGLVSVDVRFAVLQGVERSQPVEIEGQVVRRPAPAWRALAGWLRRGGAKRAYEPWVAEIATEARNDLLAIDRFVSGGPRDPQIVIRTYAPAESPD
jgi:hypothetical protein